MKTAIKIVFLASIFLSQAIVAQEEDYVLHPPRNYEKQPAKNAGFIELGGNGGLYSLNFDRIYFYKEAVKLSGRIGFTPLPHGHYFEQAYVIENNFIFLPNPHHLEFGIGATMFRRYNEKPSSNNGDYAWENIWFSIWRLGYRYQKQDDGLFFRAAITPAFMSHDALGNHPNYFQWSGGISVGMSF